MSKAAAEAKVKEIEGESLAGRIRVKLKRGRQPMIKLETSPIIEVKTMEGHQPRTDKTRIKGKTDKTTRREVSMKSR